MPELPEVETVVRSLSPLLRGQKIKSLTSPWPRALVAQGSSRLKIFRKALYGTKISALERRGKFLILKVEAPSKKRAPSSILIHLRMTGKLYLLPKLPQKNKHLSAAFLLSNQNYLIFEDQRRFGRIYYCKDKSEQDKYLARLGPEPLAKNFTKTWLEDNLRLR